MARVPTTNSDCDPTKGIGHALDIGSSAFGQPAAWFPDQRRSGPFGHAHSWSDLAEDLQRGPSRMAGSSLPHRLPAMHGSSTNGSHPRTPTARMEEATRG